MSGKKEYVKLWLSYETYFAAYTPEQVGNLVLAMLAYKDSGKTPDFQGPERFIWPAVQRDMDEAQNALETAAESSRTNGRKGGRPRKDPAEENPSGFSETQETARTKDKDKDNGHCHGHGQGQGQGQGQGSAPAGEKISSAKRLLAQLKLEEEAERAARKREQAEEAGAVFIAPFP